MARQKLAIKSTTDRKLLKKASIYRGLYARVARNLDMEISHVRRVGIGERNSRKVEAALIAEIRKIERESAA
jgi:hypothetical protein